MGNQKILIVLLTLLVVIIVGCKMGDEDHEETKKPDDNGGDYGESEIINFTTIKIGSDEIEHVLFNQYFDQSDYQLTGIYATYDKDQWQFQEVLDKNHSRYFNQSGFHSLALDTKNDAHIVLSLLFNVYYANKTSGQWMLEKVGATETGKADLKIDSSGHAHIAIPNYGDGLIYANNSNGDWILNYLPLPGDSLKVSGGSPSIAIDSNGYAHICFSSKEELSYYENTSGSWSKTVINHKSDEMSDVYIGEDGSVHICFADYRLGYATNKTGEWVKEFYIPEDEGFVDYLASTRDSDDNLYFLCKIGEEVFIFNQKITKWEETTWELDVGKNYSFAIDNQGKYHISSSYYFRNYYSTNSDGTWKTEELKP